MTLFQHAIARASQLLLACTVVASGASHPNRDIRGVHRSKRR